jgi:ATP-dependent RNA helicase DDX55/SPB4
MSATFAELQPPLLPTTLEVVNALGFAVMTPVQSATLPLFLGTKDVCVEACTGSGKTLAYVIPIVERLLRLSTQLAVHQVGALVLSPTRELAKQIHEVLSLFVAATELKALLLIGGTDVATDLAACTTRGCNIITATPGRILDIMRRCEAPGVSGPDFRRLEVLVLDEADTLLDMGFHEAITDILARLPKQRRTGLFSATQTQEVRALARAGLRNPAVVSVQVRGASSAAAGSRGGGAASSHNVQSTPLTLSNSYTVCNDSVDKLAQMCAFLRARAAGGHKAIVFVLTCASVDFFAKVLALPAVRAAAGLPDEAAFPILPLHGKQEPKKRAALYARFLAAPVAALLCTDVAARGIDVPDVDWILQYDPPSAPAYYVHRVGRTARAGRAGAALLYLLPQESSYVSLLGVRNVPVVEAQRAGVEGSAAALIPALQEAAIADRAVLEASTRAFVSFVRGYKEHDCKFIFRLDSLHVPSLASSFGCIKLPKVEELRGRDNGFVPLAGVNTSKISYADPVREAARQVRLDGEAEENAAEREARDARREVAQAKAAAVIADPAAAKGPKRKRKHGSASKTLAAEWELLQREEALEKRLRSGRISKAAYKAALAELNRSQGIDDDEDEMTGVGAGAGAPAPGQRTHQRNQDEEEARPKKRKL